MWQYNETVSSDELYHYSVPGMKWGKRTARGYDGPKKEIAKPKNVLMKKTATKKAVKKYSSSFDAASLLSDKADKKWSEVNKMYKDLGKNKASRLINAKRGKSDAAKKYSKAYDEASKLSDRADAKWRETKKLRKETGGNEISRIINNIRYGH